MARLNAPVDDAEEFLPIATAPLSSHCESVVASATTVGNLNLAVAAGKNTTAIAGVSGGYIGNLALSVGSAQVEGANVVIAGGGFGNLAANLGGTQAGVSNPEAGANIASTTALGGLNFVNNVGGVNNRVRAQGVANTATQIGGSNNVVTAYGGSGLTNPGLNRAFSLFGSNNRVTAGVFPNTGAPFAVAGVIGKHGQTVNQTTPGLNINP